MRIWAATVRRIVGISLLTTAVLLVWRDGSNGSAGPAPDLSDHPIRSTYDFGVGGGINVGVQPMYVPAGLISETMKRDVVLREQLAELGMEARFFPFLKDCDVNLFLKGGDLEVLNNPDANHLDDCRYHAPGVSA